VEWRRQGKTPRSSTRALAILLSESTSSKAGGTGRRKLYILPYEISLFILRRDLQYAVKIYDRDRWLYFASNEVILWNFAVLKNLPSSAGFEPANVASNEKQAYHYTVKDDFRNPCIPYFELPHNYFRDCQLRWISDSIICLNELILSF
jgi:hypothetical protein